MALATQCPHCQTTFRVAHDQLKLRAGLVRCGACKQIFNGIEHLLRPDDRATPAKSGQPMVAPPPISEPTKTAAVPEASTGHTDIDPVQNTFESVSQQSQLSATTSPADVADTANRVDTAGTVPTAEQSESTDTADTTGHDHDLDLYPAFNLFDPPASVIAAEPEEDAVTDPLQRMTLMQFSHADDEDEDDAVTTPVALASPATDNSATLIAASVPDEIDRAIDVLQRKPWRGSKLSRSHADQEEASEFDSDAEEPDFVTRARRRDHRSRSRRMMLVAASLLLLISAGAQGTFVFRDQLAARLPILAPWMHRTCAALGCQIALPAQIDAVTIESNELITLNQTKNIFALNLLLRNHGSVVQRWPAIELTLLDAADRPLVRRVLSERDYLLRPQDGVRGFAPNSEQPARMTFELPQQKAANYRVFLFYP